jgi:hypothetical protein
MAEGKGDREKERGAVSIRFPSIMIVREES